MNFKQPTTDRCCKSKSKVGFSAESILFIFPLPPHPVDRFSSRGRRGEKGDQKRPPREFRKQTYSWILSPPLSPPLANITGHGAASLCEPSVSNRTFPILTGFAAPGILQSRRILRDSSCEVYGEREAATRYLTTFLPLNYSQTPSCSKPFELRSIFPSHPRSKVTQKRFSFGIPPDEVQFADASSPENDSLRNDRSSEESLDEPLDG